MRRYQRPQFLWITQSQRFLCWAPGDARPAGAGADTAVASQSAEGKQLNCVALDTVVDVRATIAAKLPPDRQNDESKAELAEVSLTFAYRSGGDGGGGGGDKDDGADHDQEGKIMEVDVVFSSQEERDAWLQGLRVLGKNTETDDDGDGATPSATTQLSTLLGKLHEGLSASLKSGTQKKYQEACVVWVSPDHK